MFYMYISSSHKIRWGTSDLMYKITKNQEKTDVNPSVITGDHKVDHELEKVIKTNFYILKVFLMNEIFDNAD